MMSRRASKRDFGRSVKAGIDIESNLAMHLIFFVFCFILGCLVRPGLGEARPFSSATDRRALFEEAFQGLPYFVFAALQETSEDFQIWGNSEKLSAQEAEMARRLIHQVFPSHGKDYSLVFSNSTQHSFRLKEGEEERTAMTSQDKYDPIYVNLDRINDSQAQIDFIDAIQILIHECGHKIREKNQIAVDSLGSKVSQILRNAYSSFSIGDGRRIHVLALSRQSPFVGNDVSQMQTIWMNQLGFEVTVFDEIEGRFRSIQELRHHFADPGLLKPWRVSPDQKSALSRNSIVGLEVDRFSDQTTVIRIATLQAQTLLQNRSELQGFSHVNDLREYAITLKGRSQVQVSRRAGFLPASAPNPGLLQSFELKNSVLQGKGLLPYFHEDMKDLQLHLLVRSQNSILNIPLDIVSTDPRGPLLFQFARKVDQAFLDHELIATDILIGKDFPEPANKLALKDFKKVQIKRSLPRPLPFKLKNIFLSHQDSFGKQTWRSLKSDQPLAQKGKNLFKFVFDSQTPLQEMTLYLKNIRQVYDPQNLKSRHQLALGADGLSSESSLSPSLLDSPVSQEAEIDVLRFDARQMKQRFVGRYLEVELQVPVREATTLVEDLGPTTYQSGGGSVIKSQRRIEYGVDSAGRKDISKIVVLNENMQKISLDRELFHFTLGTLKNYKSVDQAFREYFGAFDSQLTDSPASSAVAPSCQSVLTSRR